MTFWERSQGALHCAVETKEWEGAGLHIAWGGGQWDPLLLQQEGPGILESQIGPSSVFSWLSVSLVGLSPDLGGSDDLGAYRLVCISLGQFLYSGGV